MTGFVYFIRCLDRVKIGYSEDPVKRFSKINTDAPAPCELLAFVSADDFPEAELHERFSDLRVHGEWFFCASAITNFIERFQSSEPEKIAVANLDRFERTDLTDASKLKAWRYSQKLSCHSAGALFGVSHGCWSQWENGITVPSLNRVGDFTKITGLSPAEIWPSLAGVAFPASPANSRETA